MRLGLGVLGRDEVTPGSPSREGLSRGVPDFEGWRGGLYAP